MLRAATRSVAGLVALAVVAAVAVNVVSLALWRGHAFPELDGMQILFRVSLLAAALVGVGVAWVRVKLDLSLDEAIGLGGAIGLLTLLLALVPSIVNVLLHPPS